MGDNVETFAFQVKCFQYFSLARVFIAAEKLNVLLQAEIAQLMSLIINTFYR